MPDLPSRRCALLGFSAATALLPSTSVPLSDQEVQTGLYVDLETTSISATALVIHTSGYSRSGRGAGRYALVPQGQESPYDGRTADGRRWRLSPTSGIAHLDQMGAIRSGVHFEDEAVAALADWSDRTGGIVDLGSGRLKFSRGVRLPATTCLGGDLILDLSDISASSAPQNACVLVDGGAVRALPRLQKRAIMGSHTLTFESPHGLVARETLIVLDEREFSGNPWRPVYRAGQMNRVEEVLSETMIRLREANFRQYEPQFTVCGRRSGETWQWKGGNLDILASPDVFFGLVLSDLDDISLSNIHVSGARYASLSLRRCYGGVGRNLDVIQEIDSGEGGDYGVLFESSQNIAIEGRFHGRRHGVSQGPAADKWGIMQYGCRASGRFSNDPASGTHALDAHGNSENYAYSGTCIGGLVFGGNNGQFRDLVITAPAHNGKVLACAWAGECHGFTFDFSNARLSSPGGVDPYKSAPGHAVFDFGGNGGGYTSTRPPLSGTDGFVFGGLISLTEAVIDAGESASHIVMIRNHGYDGIQTLAVDMSGLEVLGGERGIILCDSPNGRAIDVVRVENVSGSLVWNLDARSAIRQ